MNDRPLPPLPFDPYGNKLPIYTFDFISSEFLVADSLEDYKALRQSSRMMSKS